MRGEKGAQALYLRQVTAKGEFANKIPFLQRAGSMKFKHRKLDEMNCIRGFPIVTITLDSHWDPHAHFDGEMSHLANVVKDQYPTHADVTCDCKVSTWHHSETCTVFQRDDE
jgi:hypothetical protein